MFAEHAASEKTVESFISIRRMCELSGVINPRHSVLSERQSVCPDGKMKCWSSSGTQLD